MTTITVHRRLHDCHTSTDPRMAKITLPAIPGVDVTEDRSETAPRGRVVRKQLGKKLGYFVDSKVFYANPDNGEWRDYEKAEFVVAREFDDLEAVAMTLDPAPKAR